MTFMSDPGMKALSIIYSEFMAKWVENNPGCNENDVERHFLTHIYYGLNAGHIRLPHDLQHHIDNIR